MKKTSTKRTLAEKRSILPDSTGRIPFYLERLQREFRARTARNPRYTMTAFSNHLSLKPATLSRILDRKRVPSLETVDTIATRLNMKPSDRRAFVRSSVDSWMIRDIAPLIVPPVVAEIETDGFEVISEWYHYAILELTFVEGFRSEPRWIARRLGITADEASTAIRRLLRLNLLAETVGPDGEARYAKTGEKLATKDKTRTSESHRKFQKRILAQAIESLDRDPLEARSMTSLTVAIDPAQLPIARALIQDFTRHLCDVLESGTQRKVYQMGIALYPADRGDDGVK